MPTLNLSGGSYVGLIVRYKTSHTHHPKYIDQHADCILPSGGPVGFFGGGAGASGSRSAPSMAVSTLEGQVYTYDDYMDLRPEYADLNTARDQNAVSTVLMIRVNMEQAHKFARYWENLRQSPGGYRFVGNNCATHACDAFKAARVLNRDIPWLDTPDNLYQQLYDYYHHMVVPRSGYVGFVRRGRHFDVVVEPAS